VDIHTELARQPSYPTPPGGSATQPLHSDVQRPVARPRQAFPTCACTTQAKVRRFPVFERMVLFCSAHYKLSLAVFGLKLL